MEITSLSDTTNIKFLKDCDTFNGLGEEIIKVIYNHGKILKISPGDVIFESDQIAEQFYVVKNGIVEICREDEPGRLKAVAYMGSSTSLGEIKMLTGSNYNSHARMPGGGEIFTISRSVFLSLLDILPEFGRALSTLFAHRLESLTKNTRIDRKEQFRGSLKFFDLTTIIQTIVSSRLTGTLSITNDFEEPVAEVNFEEGEIRGAFLDTLVGEDAFYQLFQPPLKEGSFDFKSIPIQYTGNSKYDIHHAASALLIEAARQQDELQEMARKIHSQDIFAPAKNQLLWLGEEAMMDLAKRVFETLKTEQLTVNQLGIKLGKCSHAISSVLKIMYVTKQIERINRKTTLQP
jgi:CRP-like cAMP-binding protein